MATLRNPHTGARIMLRPVHAFGRHPSACRTVLRGADVSQIHALMRWNLQRWEILDQSRNGTFVDGTRLPRASWLPLTAGSDIVFGADIEACWTVHDLAAPLNCLIPLAGDGDVLALRAEGMFLPSVLNPEVHLHCNDDQWLLEDSHSVSMLADGSVVQTQGGRWELVLCPELARTLTSQRRENLPAASELGLHFEVSQNEEHAHLRLELCDRHIDLGERIHHYLLATLARLRLRDAQRGLDPHSGGWVSTDDLARMLGVDPPYVNIQIFRAREQFARALAPHVAAPLLVERRRGEVRLALCRFTVRCGTRIEGAST
jgi:hypothetical protein